MNTRNTSIALPTERADQLRQLSNALGGASMSETLQQLFQLARDQGLMTGHDIPGVRLNVVSDGVVIQFDDSAPAGFSFASARSLVDTIRQFIAGSNDVPHFISLDHDYSVRRKGRGIIVELNFSNNASEKAWNTDLASDFADLIEHAIKEPTPE